ncbi:MAG: UDP-N-acetylmuramate:L-alanyl-gamma-D-glutamyl-meso-diaminopimelate ligase [Desulfobacterales bacterium]|nr:UDP-N-acetylmuramate:L-alanyl-gamma-D-glutamyl-meso-diaminopimelate ligase [Desulfobacterales bacterium]
MNLPAADQGAQLSPDLNRVPGSIGHIHLIGICGTGMGALAGLLHGQGYKVTGSDRQVYPPMSDFLARLGIPVISGHGPENLVPRPDLVVVGNVVTRKNSEAVALAAAGIPYLSFPQAIRTFFLAGKRPLVVAGTHGKTTTSSMLAVMLHAAGNTPGFMIGGLVQEFGRNFNTSNSPFFVLEGDEYDTAFFDKGPKFLHYRPEIAIITSIEFDHADIYEDLEAVKRSFARLVAIMPGDGCIIACADDPVVREIVSQARCRVESYGQGADADWQLEELRVTPRGTTFRVQYRDEFYGDFASPMPGRHNGLNGLAAIAVLHRLGIGPETTAAGLASFKGVKRRQEVRGEVDGITVIDDFAHHPTAVRETLAALGEAYQGRRLIAVFEPRTNTSMRNVFQGRYAGCFDHSDMVIVREPPALHKVPPGERFSSKQLVADLASRGRDALYFADTDEILDHLRRSAIPGDVIAILSNGGFDNIHARLLDLLGARS